MEYTHVVHEFAPVYDADSTVLILGSFPSVKSREQQFYYGHPRNRFWKVIAELCNEPVPESIADKKAQTPYRTLGRDRRVRYQRV